MNILLCVAMAFIVPLLAIAAFILFDEGLTRLANYLKTKFEKRKADTQMKANSSTTSDTSTTRTGSDGPLQVLSANRPINPDCLKCAGCKLATTGGCGGRKKKDEKTDV